MAVKPSSAKRSTDEAKSSPAVSYNEFKEYEGHDRETCNVDATTRYGCVGPTR